MATSDPHVTDRLDQKSKHHDDVAVEERRRENVGCDAHRHARRCQIRHFHIIDTPSGRDFQVLALNFSLRVAMTVQRCGEWHVSVAIAIVVHRIFVTATIINDRVVRIHQGEQHADDGHDEGDGASNNVELFHGNVLFFAVPT